MILIFASFVTLKPATYKNQKESRRPRNSQPRSQDSLSLAPWGQVGENPGNEVVKLSLITYCSLKYPQNKSPAQNASPILMY